MTVMDQSSSKHHIVSIRGMTVAELKELQDVNSTAKSLPHCQHGILEAHAGIPSEKMPTAW